MKVLLIFLFLLIAGVGGMTAVWAVPLPAAISPIIGIVSAVFAIIGGFGVWACITGDGDDDDDDGPYYYGPGSF